MFRFFHFTSIRTRNGQWNLISKQNENDKSHSLQLKKKTTNEIKQMQQNFAFSHFPTHLPNHYINRVCRGKKDKNARVRALNLPPRPSAPILLDPIQPRRNLKAQFSPTNPQSSISANFADNSRAESFTPSSKNYSFSVFL